MTRIVTQINRHFTTVHALVLVIIAITIAHCSKKIDEIKEDLVVNVMTSGKWVVTGFTEGSENVTPEFSLYEFQFLEDGTVKGIKDGTVVQTGTWVGNAAARTISSNFPGSNDTLKRLNDTWQIVKNSLTKVEAKPSGAVRTAYLKLEKK